MQVNGLHCRYILQSPPPINETDFQDAHIIEILLKVALNTQKNQPNHNIQLLIVYFIKISHIFHNSFIMWTIWFIKYIILNLNPINIMRSLIFLFFYNLIISATASNTRCSHLDFCQYKCIYIHVGYSGACTCICLLCLTMNMCSYVYMLFT